MRDKSALKIFIKQIGSSVERNVPPQLVFSGGWWKGKKKTTINVKNFIDAGFEIKERDENEIKEREKSKI